MASAPSMVCAIQQLTYPGPPESHYDRITTQSSTHLQNCRATKHPFGLQHTHTDIHPHICDGCSYEGQRHRQHRLPLRERVWTASVSAMIPKATHVLASHRYDKWTGGVSRMPHTVSAVLLQAAPTSAPSSSQATSLTSTAAYTPTTSSQTHSLTLSAGSAGIPERFVQVDAFATARYSPQH
jgi:hypothetical protein